MVVIREMEVKTVIRNRGYQMTVGLTLNLLNKLNKSILCEHLAGEHNIILFKVY